MRIVFMGTPDFAVSSLRRLVEDGHEIAGVFTQPDKPGNRKKMTPPPVKVYAESIGLPVYQPERMRGEEPLALLRSLAPELTVVAAYGKILPEDILDVPKLGSINVHASVLPKYRGAAPINWAILNGETETGVTIQYMAKKVDSGDIIGIKTTPITPEDDAETMFVKLAELGAELLSETIPAIAAGTVQRTPQDEAEATFTTMLSREMSPIDWRKPAQTIVNQVRGLVPWPCASTMLDGKVTKVWHAELGGKASDSTGTMRASKRGVEVACGDGNTVIISELQSEGGKRMAASAWLNGKRVAPGIVIA